MMSPRVLSAATAKQKYYRAEACYKKLRHSPKKQKYRDKWLTCIENFDSVYRHDPQGPWAAAGLYMSGQLYQELYKRSFKKSDKEAAVHIYDSIVSGFPRSRYYPKAEIALRHLRYKTTQKFVTKNTTSYKYDKKKADDEIEAEIEKYASATVSVKKNIKAPVSETATISGLRYWSNPNYTRVVVDADNDIVYSHKLLKKDASNKKPQRLYIDLNNSQLKKDIKKTVPINDDLLLDVRAGQFASNRVRVVVDIKSFKRYKIFSLKNPFRIVIDIWGEVAPSSPVLKANIKGEKLPPGALAKQLALGVQRIVIDPGHGGKDYGAPGFQRGVYEKGINLMLARRLARKIRKELGCEVIMTRNSDRYLTLEERTAIANTKNADLFISIHTNASRDKSAYGIETFYLNLATDNDAILVAARENATSTKNISDLETILSDLMQNAKINESSRLAVYVQKSMCRYLGNHYSRVRGNGVKQAPFYVLLGAQMPAILIETSFISNPRECQRLRSTAYQDRISEAIILGIKSYIRDMNPTAFMDKNPNPISGKYGG
ncbi:MAG: N-acetylmuramoyl-L-alanine amidase [Desulfobacterales bacterium]|jgi:N-acetylmuramoyl-L-alanine amidase|nr:N-acetylmuramoyl-L-alanine amidase [Desulfobacterales bacterium]